MSQSHYIPPFTQSRGMGQVHRAKSGLRVVYSRARSQQRSELSGVRALVRSEHGRRRSARREMGSRRHH
jgi:hypothetical protein